jgi:hypothetical protein
MRIREAIDKLDEMIRELRKTIFDIRLTISKEGRGRSGRHGHVTWAGNGLKSLRQRAGGTPRQGGTWLTIHVPLERDKGDSPPRLCDGPGQFPGNDAAQMGRKDYCPAGAHWYNVDKGTKW